MGKTENMDDADVMVTLELDGDQTVDCEILTIFTIVPLDETILRLAANLPHKDFEDAIQTFSAVHAKAE